MKTVVCKLVWPAYVAAIIFLSYTGIDQYLNASSILNDHTVVEAPIELAKKKSRTKRGHTSTTYIFNYTYTVDGKDYVSKYSAVNEHGERYLDEPIITIAYSNANPAKVGTLESLESRSSLGGLIKSILISALILGLVALFVWGWALPDEEESHLPEGVKD